MLFDEKKISSTRVKFSHKRINFAPKRMKFFPKRKKMDCLIREQINCLRQNKLSPKRKKSFQDKMFFWENEIISFGETSDNMSN